MSSAPHVAKSYLNVCAQCHLRYRKAPKNCPASKTQDFKVTSMVLCVEDQVRPLRASQVAWQGGEYSYQMTDLQDKSPFDWLQSRGLCLVRSTPNCLSSSLLAD